MKKFLGIVLAVCLLFSFSYSQKTEISLNFGLAMNPKWDTSMAIGAIINSSIFGRIQAEGEFFFYTNADKESDYIDQYSSSSSAWNINVFLLYPFFTEGSNFIPYVALGSGVFHQGGTWEIDWGFFTNSGDWSSTKLNLAAGGGFKYLFSGTMGLRVDYRAFFILGVSGDVHRITIGIFKVF